MAKATAPRKVSDALQEVARWRQETDAKHRSELGEVDQEIESLRTAVANLQQQLEALRRFRDEVARRGDRTAEEEIDRSYQAIFAALLDQSAALRDRSQAVVKAEKARLDGVWKAIEKSELAPLLVEYNQFKTTVEPTLAALPESYRSVILQHHEQISRRLNDHVRAQTNAPVQVDGGKLEAEVVLAVDAPEGKPEVLMLVLPVDESAQPGGGGTLLHSISTRVVDAIRKGCADAGLKNAEPAFGGHQGLLAVEVDVNGARDDVGAKVQAAIEAALASADDLRAAGVVLGARTVVVDHLLPPEEEPAGEAEATA